MSVLVLSLGLHWALLQTVAWTGMLITYSKTDSLREAASKTFDGKHPCPLCKMVQAGRAKEKGRDQQQVKPGLKLDLAWIWQAPDCCFASDRQRILSPDLYGPSRCTSPPRPPPRGMLDNPAFA